MWRLLAIALVCASCGLSHQPPDPPTPCRDGGCEGDAVCYHAEPGDEGVCLERCYDVGRCDNGAACSPYSGGRVCWSGGGVPEGGRTLTGFDCEFGLRDRADYETEPLAVTCEPACDDDTDCRSGERCSSWSCATPCDGPGSVACAPGSRCVTAHCVNARRFARIDCNGDGVWVPTECRPYSVCDAAAIGGCRDPDRGTE